MADSKPRASEKNQRPKNPFRPGTTLRNRSGPVIRRLRLAREWSQNDLAADLQRGGWDVSRENLAQIETGRRAITDHEVVLLCQVFKVTAGQLLGLETLPATSKAASHR